MTHAIAFLENAAEIAENNAPIHAAEGNMEQAALCREQADSYREAIRDLHFVSQLPRMPTKLQEAEDQAIAYAKATIRNLEGR